MENRPRINRKNKGIFNAEVAQWKSKCFVNIRSEVRILSSALRLWPWQAGKQLGRPSNTTSDSFGNYSILR